MRFRQIAAAAALAMFLGGCAGAANSNRSADPDNVSKGSAAALAERAGAGLEVDYTPLASPADAVAKADLIVRGTLVKVTDGIQVGGAGRSVGQYATFVVKVDEVLAGKAQAGATLYVAVLRSTSASPAELNKLNSSSRVALVLDDITSWSPYRGAKVVRPAGVPADAPLYMPYTDGVWMQGAADKQMHGIGAHLTDLSAAWGSAQTVDQFSAKITAAAKGR
jgi:hypothetical protein